MSTGTSLYVPYRLSVHYGRYIIAVQDIVKLQQAVANCMHKNEQNSTEVYQAYENSTVTRLVYSGRAL